MPEPPPEAATSRWLDAPRPVGDPLPGRPRVRGARRRRSSSRRPTRCPSASRTRTSRPTTGSGARRRGRWSPAAPAWSSTGTGTRSTSAHETYWLGVLNHDGEPGRCYAEVQRIAGELDGAGDAVVDLVPDADVGLLYSRESKWAMEFHPPLAGEGGVDRIPAPTTASSARFYEGLFGAGVQADIVYPQQLLDEDAEALVARWPVLLAPGALRRRRRAAGPAAAYARGGRAPRARHPQRLRRRRGARARTR